VDQRFGEACGAVTIAVCLLLNLNATVFAQRNAKHSNDSARSLHDSKKPDGEWPAYARDGGGEHYSPLVQINRDNVKNLKVAWSYRTGAADVKGRSVRNAAFEATPILVDGTLYLSTPFNRVIALDPATGKEKAIPKSPLAAFQPGPIERPASAESTSRLSTRG
jgi:glucose dehydrogenase